MLGRLPELYSNHGATRYTVRGAAVKALLLIWRCGSTQPATQTQRPTPRTTPLPPSHEPEQPAASCPVVPAVSLLRAAWAYAKECRWSYAYGLIAYRMACPYLCLWAHRLSHGTLLLMRMG